MRLIVGLGNPGREYTETRHNAGFMLADRLARKWGAPWRAEAKFFGELAEASPGGERLWLLKPQTFMNLSGEAVGRVARFHKVATPDILVLVDDADLALGTLRLRGEGRSGGHHGLDSVTTHVGGESFPRLRLGVARPDQKVRDIAHHVLGRFSPEEQDEWERALDRAVKQVEAWLTLGLAQAMNLYNGSAGAGPQRKDRL